MTHRIRFAPSARADLERLYRFLAEQDISAAEAAWRALDQAWGLLGSFPFAARKVDPDNALLRELVIPFGGSGYVAIYRIDDSRTVTILAVRHQREDDYH
ncbi:MAG TPA: type II toxin-antitoxin system RelE/ParE family toxin [Rhodanobacteraceae bacterium]|nr:type II toxin-antitoxin system RelE/ParE family toxin [Rhodanobacteraceae bacterium]